MIEGIVRPALVALALTLALPTGCAYDTSLDGPDEAEDVEASAAAVVVTDVQTDAYFLRFQEAISGAVMTNVQRTGVIDKARADANFPDAFEVTLWDFWKAKTGKDFGANNQFIDIGPAKRRTYIKQGSRNAGDLFQQIFKRANRKGHRDMEKMLEKVYNETLVADGIPASEMRAMLAVDASFNVFYVVLPTTIRNASNTRDLSVDQRVQIMKGVVRWLPVAHRHKIYPVFIIDKKPAAGDDRGGGTWLPADLKGAFDADARFLRSKLKYATITKLLPVVGFDSSTPPKPIHADGIVGIPLNRINADDTGTIAEPNFGIPVWGLTITHELGHSVDFVFKNPVAPGFYGLRNAHTESDALPGQDYNGDLTPVAGERVAEAYSRIFMHNTRLCRHFPVAADLDTQAECDAAVIKYMNSVRAQTLNAILFRRQAGQYPFPKWSEQGETP